MASHELVTVPASDLKTGVKRFALQFCVSVTLCVVLLCLGEGLAAVYLLLNPPLSPYRHLTMSAEYARELEDSRKQQYVSYVEWRRAPYHGRFINVDAAGLRQTVHSNCDDPTAPVIWMFGDSVLWGTGAADAETIPSQLVGLYERAGRRVCIVNYAESAWVSTQETLEFLLALKHAARKPEIVVFYDGVNQVDPLLEGVAGDRHEGYDRFRELLEDSQKDRKPGFSFLDKTNTVRALRQISDRVSNRMYRLQDHGDRTDAPPAPAGPSSLQMLAIYQQNMDLVDAMSRQYGFRSYFFWYPTSTASPKPLTPEEQASKVAEHSSMQARRICDVYAAVKGVQRENFFFLGDMFAAHPERLYLDDLHLTARGSLLSAQHVFEVLQAAQVSSTR